MAKLVTPKPNIRRQVRPRSTAEVQQQALLDLAAVAATPEGRRVLWLIITNAGWMDRIKAPNPDIHFLEGRRDVACWLVDWLTEADPNLIPLMMQETVNANLVAPVTPGGDSPDEDQK